MRHLDFDKRLAESIKLLREDMQIKQYSLAKSLNISQSTYSKIEKGLIAITPGQLKIISEELGTSHFKILEIVELNIQTDSWINGIK